MKLTRLLFTACCLSATSVSSYSQTQFFKDSSERLQKVLATQKVVEQLYRQQGEKFHFPGMAWAVVVDGKLAYSGTTGFTDVEKKTAVTTSSAFRIASMSKSFTALAILQLRDAGKLKLDDPASRYIPELGKAKLLTTDAPAITIRHLLTHAAGFPEDNPWGDRQLDAATSELLQLARQPNFSTTPGTVYEYSNVGYALLGQVITKASGMPYQQYITQHILLPLGMRNTAWEYTKLPAAQLANGYRWTGEGWTKEPLLHDGSYGAMGGLITTIDDFVKYMLLHLQAWPPRSGGENPVIKRSSLREMHHPSNFINLNSTFRYVGGRPCPMTSFYGYGLRWFTDCAAKTYSGHSGGLPGFGSNWNILSDYGVGLVCFANVTYAPLGTFNLSVLDTIVRLSGLQKRVVEPSPILKQRKAELTQLLPHWKDAERSGIFAENFFADYSLATLRKEAGALFARIGKINAITELQAENNLRGSFMMVGESGSAEVFFTLTPEPTPKIQEFSLRELKRQD